VDLKSIVLVNKLANDNPELISELDDSGKTPLFWAVERGHFDIALLLLKLESPVDTQDKYGNSLISESLWHENIELTKILAEHGANVNLSSKGQMTPLHTACFLANIDLVKLLVSFGANIESLDYMERPPLILMLANSEANEETIYKVAEFLIDCGAKINVTDKRGNSAKSLAKKKGYQNIYKLLSLSKSK